ncbi:MAG: hypothetical protein J6T98_12375, partial [Salinivirgaceae bacterium]|nr:hypothetical protein [Salinivirgaceae bacterium]
MRKFTRIYLLVIFAIAGIAAFTACSNDDDEDVPNNAGEHVTIGGTVGEIVDLGLSVKWANQNVGAASEEDFGKYFVFGETAPKADYTWDTYKWGTAETLTKYQLSSVDNSVKNGRTLELEDDPARVNWGGKWRTPTQREINELLEKATWTWKKVNGVNGHEVVGPNGNSIFIPAAGYQSGTETYNV